MHVCESCISSIRLNGVCLEPICHHELEIIIQTCFLLQCYIYLTTVKGEWIFEPQIKIDLLQEECSLFII